VEAGAPRGLPEDGDQVDRSRRRPYAPGRTWRIMNTRCVRLPASTKTWNTSWKPTPVQDFVAEAIREYLDRQKSADADRRRD
jgi:hypothetical protein